MKQLNLVQMTREDTRLLNTLFVQNSEAYTDMIDGLSRKWGRSLYWWATCLASRNPWLSFSYKNICIILLAIFRVEQDGDINEIIVSCEEIKCVLQRYFKDKNRDIIIFADKGPAGFDVGGFISMVIQNIFLKSKVDHSWQKPDLIQSGDHIILVDTEILASHIRKGIYTDRLFDNIEDLTDKKIVFMPQIVSDIASEQNGLIKKIRKYRSQNTVLKEQYLKWQDYLKLLFIPFWNRRFCKGKKYFNGIDVTPVINRDLKSSMATAQLQDCVLKHQLIRRMWQRKIEIETLVGWYEGQPSSLGMFAAYNKLYRKGKSIGYIGFAMDENWLSLAPSKEQIKQKVAPGQIGVIGEVFISAPKSFCKETKTVIFPAFRIKVDDTDYCKPEKGSLLVALSYTESASRRILKMIKDIDEWLKDNHFKVYIKNHPQLSNRTLKDYGINELNCNYVFLDQSFNEALKCADIVITAQSTTSYETVIHGKKVIVLGMAGDITFTYMPEEWKGNRYGVAYDGEELIHLIIAFNDKKTERLDLSREYLVRPQEEEIKNIL